MIFPKLSDIFFTTVIETLLFRSISSNRSELQIEKGLGYGGLNKSSIFMETTSFKATGLIFHSPFRFISRFFSCLSLVVLSPFSDHPS